MMRAIGLSLAALAVLTCVGFAQALPGHPKSSASLVTSSATVLAAGTTICVALADSIDARKAKPGDAITARVTLPVLSQGKVIIPNDAKITGHVTWRRLARAIAMNHRLEYFLIVLCSKTAANCLYL